DNSAEGMTLAKLNDAFFSDFPKLVMGSADTFSADYDAFVAKCDSLGLPSLEAYWTERYQLFNSEE
ncbi:MAG: hypothetical protein PHO66_05800, partial [Eubacteriales bacterium]|nr:hypothetical protein [Eubacteriales bacterium]